MGSGLCAGRAFSWIERTGLGELVGAGSELVRAGVVEERDVSATAVFWERRLAGSGAEQLVAAWAEAGIMRGKPARFCDGAGGWLDPPDHAGYCKVMAKGRRYAATALRAPGTVVRADAAHHRIFVRVPRGAKTFRRPGRRRARAREIPRGGDRGIFRRRFDRGGIVRQHRRVHRGGRNGGGVFHGARAYGHLSDCESWRAGGGVLLRVSVYRRARLGQAEPGFAAVQGRGERSGQGSGCCGKTVATLPVRLAFGGCGCTGRNACATWAWLRCVGLDRAALLSSRALERMRPGVISGCTGRNACAT